MLRSKTVAEIKRSLFKSSDGEQAEFCPRCAHIGKVLPKPSEHEAPAFQRKGDYFKL